MYSFPRIVSEIPSISTEQMIEVDRLMINEYGILLIQMMENAGRALAILAKERFLQKPQTHKVIVLAGTGGNGGGALVCARRLHNWGFDVAVSVTAEDKLREIPRHQFDILRHMDIEIIESNDLEKAKGFSLIIDGIIGYSLKNNPIGVAQSFISWANNANTPILSLDTPSGLDLTSGQVHTPCIKAHATLTLALPKTGLFSHRVKSIRGDLYLADISVPPSLYKKMGIEVGDIFHESDIVQIVS